MTPEQIPFVGDSSTHPELAPYWEACDQDSLLLQRCCDTNQLFCYPRGISPFTLSANIEWVEARGSGTIYSFSAVSGKQPYVIAYITLDEGVTMMAGIIDADPEVLAIGQRVAVRFLVSESGQKLPFFTPA